MLWVKLGDKAKGKVIAQLAKSGKYNFVCRWNGGDNEDILFMYRK